MTTGKLATEKCDGCGRVRDDVESREKNYKLYRLCSECA